MEELIYSNKVCCHTIIITLSNDFFNVQYLYKNAKQIRDAVTLKYTADRGYADKQKFIIGNYYQWELTQDKDIKAQINEYHKLLKDLKAKNINSPDEFVVGLLLEKLPKSQKTKSKAVAETQTKTTLSHRLDQIYHHSRHQS